MKPRLSPRLVKWMWQSARRCNHRQMLAAGQHLKAILDSSMREYKRLMHDEALPCEWKETGLLYVLRPVKVAAPSYEAFQSLTNLAV